MSNFRLVITILTILTISACASKPIDHEALKRDKISNILVASKTALSHEPSTTGGEAAAVSGGGLIGALVGSGIDTNINSKRIKNFEPINEIFQGEDLRAMLSEQLGKLTGEVFSEGLSVEVSDKMPSTKNMKNNSLNVDAKYHLSEDHQTALINVQTILKTDQEGGVFYNAFSGTSSVDLGGTKVEREDVTQFWLDNPEELKNTINAAIRNVALEIENYYNTDQTKK